jgi:hypothetical protein
MYLPILLLKSSKFKGLYILSKFLIFDIYLLNIFKAFSKSSFVSIPKDFEFTFTIAILNPLSIALNCSSFSIFSSFEEFKLQNLFRDFFVNP